MKTIIVLTILALFFGCSKKEIKDDLRDNEPVQTQVMQKLISTAIKANEMNTTLSDAIQEDGVVIDGAREEALFDAFGLAISQIIIQEGVTVPSCASLASTGYISQQDCDEITQRYFGFYDINEDGNAQKVDDMFSDGIVAEEINIRDARIEYFDNSNNPLIRDLFKLKEIIKNSSDLTLLQSIKYGLPLEGTPIEKELDKKILLLGGTLKEPTAQEVRISMQDLQRKKLVEGDKKSQTTPTTDGSKNTDSKTNTEREQKLAAYTLISSQLSSLKSKHEGTRIQMQQDPDNQNLIDTYNDEERQISALEQELNSLKAAIL